LVGRNILLSLGVFALLAGALLAVLWFRQSAVRTEAVVPQIPTELVLVATHWIPAGFLMRPGDVTWSEVAVTGANGSDIVRGSVDQTAYVGAVTRRAFAAGEAIWMIALIRPGDSEFLVAALRPGFRAISIAVDAPEGGAGLVLPGDRVDVILTQMLATTGADTGHKAVGETVLHDLRVIAADQTLIAVAKPTGPAAAVTDARIPKTITLEVTERQAEKLLVAEQLGKIQLSLLGLVDQQATPVTPPPPEVPPVWASDVSPALSGHESAAPEANSGPIEVMHGAKIERRCVTNAGLITCP